MLIRQSKNSFIRCTPNYGYITNQLSRHDRTYDSYGADLLKTISRTPKDVDEIVHKLLSEYSNVDFETLKKDFMEFACSLADDHFVVMGETESELDKQDMSFSYSLDNPKTLSDDFYQQTNEKVVGNTRDFFLEEVQGRPLISNLQFELSSRCNERCIHCYIPNEKKNHGFDMPIEKVKSIIDEFSDMGGIHITLSGGEVFLHKGLKQIVEYCRKKDLKITLLSNLISMKDDDVLWIKNNNISLIQVSLYSMDAKIHDTITTVKGSWKKTKIAIEKLIAEDIPVQISCPIMKVNKEGYRRILEYARIMKIKAQTDYMLFAQTDLKNTNLAQRISIEDTAVVLRDIIKNDIKYYEETLAGKSYSEEYAINPERYLKQPVCGVGYDNCCVAANGDVYPCAGWQGYVLGNLYKQSLKEIWEDSKRVKTLRKITQASFPQCINCEAQDYCNRCLMRNYNESGGDMFAINKYFCQIAFLNKKLVEEEFGPEFERRERILEQRKKKKASGDLC